MHVHDTLAIRVGLEWKMTEHAKIAIYYYYSETSDKAVVYQTASIIITKDNFQGPNQVSLLERSRCIGSSPFMPTALTV